MLILIILSYHSHALSLPCFFHRTAIYRAFSRNGDNIGDITAKGEAQIAVIDLLGMFAGIFISKITSASRGNLLGMFLFFSVLELLCIFFEVKSVVFDTLNFERAGIVLQDLLNRSDHAITFVGDSLRPEKIARIVSDIYLSSLNFWLVCIFYYLYSSFFYPGNCIFPTSVRRKAFLLLEFCNVRSFIANGIFLYLREKRKVHRHFKCTATSFVFRLSQISYRLEHLECTEERG